MWLYEVIDGKLDKLLAWGNYLESNPEARETLREEAVLFEALLYVMVDNRYLAFGVTDNPKPLPATDRDINRRHRAILKECLRPRAKLLPIYKLRVDPQEPMDCGQSPLN